MNCPECKGPINVNGAVTLEVRMSGGSELAGSGSDVHLPLCGKCAKAVLGKYAELAVAAHNAIEAGAAAP